MGLYEDIAAYREPRTKGVSNQLHPGDHSCDNSVLFSAEYIVLLMRSATDQAIKLQEIEWYEAFVQSCRQAQGLLTRYPADTGNEEQDDYIGAITVLYLVSDHAPIERWYAWGLAYDFCFNNASPYKFDLDQWLGRFPDFKPFVKCAVGEPLNFFDKVRISLAYLYSILFDKPGDTSSIILLWMKSQVIFGKYSLCDWMIKQWRKKWMKTYPQGMKSVFTIYFGAEHSLSKYAPEDLS